MHLTIIDKQENKLDHQNLGYSTIIVFYNS